MSRVTGSVEGNHALYYGTLIYRVIQFKDPEGLKESRKILSSLNVMLKAHKGPAAGVQLGQPLGQRSIRGKAGGKA